MNRDLFVRTSNVQNLHIAFWVKFPVLGLPISRNIYSQTAVTRIPN